jgi:hypothetical protein
VLGLRRPADPPIVVDEGSQRLNGVVIRRLRWSVGYGPDTGVWLLRPAGVQRNLPGVLGMHCHGGVHSVGAEQLVDLGTDSSRRAVWLREAYYSGRAPARLWSLMDWPELTALGRARFLVQYRADDELFPRAGMDAAHDQLLRLHAGTTRYRGSFTPGGHAFDAAMQDEAWAFLAEAL